MKNNLNILLIIGILFLIMACRSLPTETKEFKSGRLKYIETLKYGPAGTHGSNGWYINDREFNVKGYFWQPPEDIRTKDISGCQLSPNAEVEAIKCEGFFNSKEESYILRMNGNEAEWVKVSSTPFTPDDKSGEWTSDGHWLIFKDFYFNVLTSERREIKDLPDYPHRSFLANSPDLETIVYKESCFAAKYNKETNEPLNPKEHEKQCHVYEEHIKNNIMAFWLINAKTGNVKILELKRENYPWVGKDEKVFQPYWLDAFKGKFVWEKDKDGKYQLTYPN